MEEGYTNLPTSHLLGSVPAIVSEDIPTSVASQASPANLQVFPPANGSHHTPGSPHGPGDQDTTSWKGVFDISSYRKYFNVDTDVVVSRLISSVYPMNDFPRKIDDNPDLYAPVWVSTTLVFILAALGNTAAYLMHEKYHSTDQWNFDVSYVTWATCLVYGYLIFVPTVFYFLFRYFGSNISLIHLWCVWGYSLFIFIPTTLFLVIPVEILRWTLIILAGFASSWFVVLNLKALMEGSDVMTLVFSAAVVQFSLALIFKIIFVV